jgi:hypothetical protein
LSTESKDAVEASVKVEALKERDLQDYVYQAGAAIGRGIFLRR